MAYFKVIKLNKKIIFTILILIFIFIVSILLHFIKNVNTIEKLVETPNSQFTESEKTIDSLPATSAFVLEKGVVATESLFDETKLKEINTSLNLQSSEPKILITHTHINENYIDGIGVDKIGEDLANILSQEYGFSVLHDTNHYDKVDGVVTVTGAYERMSDNVENILEEYPSIEVVIDIHRDALDLGSKRTVILNNEEVSPLMLVNGICSAEDSPQSEFIAENLALSLDIYRTSEELYEGLFRKNYIKAYRYSTYMKPMSILLEVGFNTNTYEESKKSIELFAHTFVKAIE